MKREMKSSSRKRSKSEEALFKKIFDSLNARINANPYGWDGELAKQIRKLPKGLRAMAATHHLDISLTLDDIGWHFLNFGENSHVKETEMGLRELGMDEMANLFDEAHRIMKPHLRELRKPGADYYKCLEETGEMKRIKELTDRAWAIQKQGGIYSSWLNYAHAHPDDVFGKE